MTDISNLGILELKELIEAAKKRIIVIQDESATERTEVMRVKFDDALLAIAKEAGIDRGRLRLSPIMFDEATFKGYRKLYIDGRKVDFHWDTEKLMDDAVIIGINKVEDMLTGEIAKIINGMINKDEHVEN